MYFEIPNVVGLGDDAYVKALDVDDLVVWPINKAGYEIYDIVSYFSDNEGIDNEAQRVYIRGQVDDLIYQLKNVRDKLEG